MPRFSGPLPHAGDLQWPMAAAMIAVVRAWAAAPGQDALSRAIASVATRLADCTAVSSSGTPSWAQDPQ